MLEIFVLDILKSHNKNLVREVEWIETTFLWVWPLMKNIPLLLTTIINQKTAKNSLQWQSFTDKISHNATPSALFTKHLDWTPDVAHSLCQIGIHVYFVSFWVSATAPVWEEPSANSDSMSLNLPHDLSGMVTAVR